MMPSTNNVDLSAERLCHYLAQVLPASRLSLSEAKENLEPLVFLKTNHVLAGFALSNGDARKSYEILYQEFKGQLKNSEGAWNGLDVAFVFCVKPNIPELEQFCSNIETNVYFCRKFVVPVGDSFEGSLSGLPFLPLGRLNETSFRPPSAQNFLVASGVPAALARYIVVQGERGVDRIIDGCVAGEFGKTVEPTAAKLVAAPSPEPASETVRLETLEIKNFRAYRGLQSFRFGKSITLLYGPNGFGKTSLFDAIDFVATGGIGRLKTSDSQFPKVARHLDAPSEESEVSVTLSRGQKPRRISRNVNTRKDASLDGHPTDRKAILAELTGREMLHTDRVEHFVDLFRATHLFNQEAPELGKSFRDDCRLDPDIVSRLLAFQDYTNALNKLQKLQSSLESITQHADYEIKEATRQIEAEKFELDRLAVSTQKGLDPSALAAQFEAMKSKLAKLGIEAKNGTLTVQTLRDWRGTIEGRQAESRRKTDLFGQLLKEISALPKIRTELSEKQEDLSVKEKELEEAEKRFTTADESRKTADRHLAEIGSSLTIGQTQAATFQWYRANRPVYLQLIERQRQVGSEVAEVGMRLERLRTTEELAASEFRAAENLKNQISARQTRAEDRIKSIKVLQSAVPAWEEKQRRLASFSKDEGGFDRTLAELRLSEKESAVGLLAEREKEAKLTNEVNEADRERTELSVLVSKLQSRVVKGACPLCGHDHGNKSRLLENIESHVQADPASAARAALAATKESIEKLQTTLMGCTQKQNAIQLSIAFIQSQKLVLAEEIQSFLNSVSKLGTGIVQKEVVSDFLSALLADAEKDFNSTALQAKTANEATETANSKVTGLRGSISQQLTDESVKKAALVRITSELEILRTDPRWKHAPLDITDDQMDLDEKANAGRIATLQKEFSSVQSKLPSLIEAASKTRQDHASLKEHVLNVRSQTANLRGRLTQATAKLSQAGIPSNVTEADLLERIVGEARMQSQLDALRDSASNLELTLDAATTAAALMGRRENIRNKEKIIEAANSKREQHQPWLSFFSRVSRLLTTQQNVAIETFTKEYGPRTSVIQRRLRSVYGFDHIEICSRDSSVYVRVTRNGQELRPTDYFSQSQQQTLLLGLFLTTCISQTWSGFAPIFMDDPVTHFDDLNAYAFLDLIVGLLESDSCKRQFIISTCDEKLLQLARQKFRHLGDGAVFYRFDAIGANGPVIREIPNL